MRIRLPGAPIRRERVRIGSMCVPMICVIGVFVQGLMCAHGMSQGDKAQGDKAQRAVLAAIHSRLNSFP